ncbi:MAG: metallophosphoesterase family protein, partial [Candidatus Hermodarchaeota archaeon]
MNKKFSILHFSDLHFGELSVQQMGKYKTSFDDFFYYFLKKVQGIIDDKSTDLVIISGDLTSRGKKKDLHNHFLMKFLDVFIENKVPIITCNGNHDLSREKIELGGQFDFYQEFINENKDRFQCELSKHFDINQISYVFLDSLNCLFFSINSCRNIENRFLDSKNEIHDKDYTDVGIFSAKELDLFLEEIRDKFGNRYHSMNIFLVSHHPMRRFSESIYSIKCLSERNISIVFSGHEHNYEFQE